MIYEVHVKGFTARHPGIPKHLRGTYAGLAHPASVDYLRRLGVTAVELMPVHQRAHPILRRRRWLVGATAAGGAHDVDWVRPDGAPMKEEDWNANFAKAIGVFLNGEAIPSRDVKGERITDDSFLMLLNAHHEPVDFTLPAAQWGRRWELLLDSAVDSVVPHRRLTFSTSDRIQLSGHSLVLLRRVE